MFKSSLTAICAAILVLSAGQARSQQLPSSEQSRVAQREAEWNAYLLPQSTFARQTDPAQTLLFLVPSEWKRDPEKLSFVGPHGATLTVFVEKISDGIPLRDYVAAMMQPLRNFADSDAMVVRRTSMSGLEAREIMFETDADSAEVTRRIIWTTVSGPNAISLLLIVPIANTPEIEPSFKTVVQSVTLLDKTDYAGFDDLRTRIIKDPAPIRVDEVQSLAASLASLNGSSRRASISRLAAIFSTSPATAIDLVLDARPMVRAAAIEALSESRHKPLDKFLVRALDDRELFVAEQAARSVAANPDVFELLRTHSLEWFKIESLARVWPFLARDKQIRILKEIFAQAPVPNTIRARASEKGRASSAAASTSPGRPSVTVRATVLKPGAPPPPIVTEFVALTSDPSRQLNGLTLLKDVPALEFKLPLGQMVAWESEPLTALALQVAWERSEPLPPADLLKLLSAPGREVRSWAAWHLGESGNVGDIKSIASYINKPATAAVVNDQSKPADGDSSQVNDLQTTISKIYFREQVGALSGEARAQLIQKGLIDPKLSEWVWYRYVRDNGEPAGESKPQSARAVKALPLGENLFPREVTYYAALPDPAAALDKLSSAFDGLRLESARSQANLVLVTNVLREQLGQQLDSPPGAAPMTYSGINTKEPIAMASWIAAGAPAGVPTAERHAIVLRVADRARFERTLTVYQRSVGGLKSFSGYFSGGSRFLTLLPAFLPLTAKAMLDGSISRPKQAGLVRYSFVGGMEWNGYSIKVIEHRAVDAKGHLTTDSAYLTYLGDAAILAPDLVSLRDVLTRASSDQATLASNRDFQRLTSDQGEAIYLSNLRQLVAEPGGNKDLEKPAVTESGALKISNSIWENLYQIHFAQSDWRAPLKTFHPEELTAPRELLPRSTIAYYFMKVDAVAGWRDWSEQLLTIERRKELTSSWAMDFEKDVLPELGEECGVAVLGLPNIMTDNWNVPWAAFFKLKTDKLSRAFEAGKLLNGNAAEPGLIHLKLKSGDLFVDIKNGFLVIANNRDVLTALDQKEKLVASRDFSRAAKQAPSGVVAFGGYSLEAAISAIGDSGSDPLKTQQSALVFSLTKAFHSPNFYATAGADTVEGRFSLSMDREGAFSVSELSSLSSEYRLTYAQVEARGVPIQNQERLSSLKIRIRANAAGEIDRIKQDVVSASQIAEKVSDKELELRILPRHSEPKTSLLLPIKNPELAPYLKPAGDIPSEDKSVIEKALSIAGDERDAWKVAGKLADWTYKNIKWKRVDYATAPQTLATLEADCLEFSQLYVAMARSLGLPARLVSGLAYSGATFGGHAWVEVYVGEWIEVDPTWGTSFVDATHIRNSSSGALLTYAALNLVQLEVLEAPRGIAEFQKDPRALAEKLSHELPRGNLTALTSALDLAVLTDENFGGGTWVSLTGAEREAMTSAYRRLLLEIAASFRPDAKDASDLRLLKINLGEGKAKAVVLAPGFAEPLEKLSFVQRDGAWFLTEILQVDSDFHTIAEILRPAVKTIMDRRKDKSARGQSASDSVRILLVMVKDAKASIVIADRALKDDPKNQGLRHLKAIALTRSEKQEEAIQLWKELAAESKPFAPAFLSLASQYKYSDDKTKQQLAIEFYTRYGELEPDDPRTHVELARLYETGEDDVRAEAEHRAALKSDPANTGQYVDFATFLVERKRFEEAALVIAEADKHAGAKDDLFGDLMSQLYLIEDKTIPEEVAKRQPERMGKSAWANLYLGYVRMENGQSLQAIPLLKKAIALKADWSEPHAALARGYRNLQNWPAALKAADKAISIEAESSDAHFNRACALARLGRITEALKSLAKAVELDPDLPEMIEDEADLKALAARPEFKKLMAVQEGK